MSPIPPLDEQNELIVELLKKDGRMSFSEMSDTLGISQGTIRNRVNSMRKSGALQIVAMVDPAQIKYNTDAMLGITVASSATPESVCERLSQFNEVVYALWVSGRFDLLVEVASGGQDDFLTFLNEHIYGQPDIHSVEVMSGLKNFKNQFLLKRNWK
ncbi:MAG: Lrp/AsnC family transcriptional regulator [Arenicella sp.]